MQWSSLHGALFCCQRPLCPLCFWHYIHDIHAENTKLASSCCRRPLDPQLVVQSVLLRRSHPTTRVKKCKKRHYSLHRSEYWQSALEALILRQNSCIHTHTNTHIYVYLPSTTLCCYFHFVVPLQRLMSTFSLYSCSAILKTYGNEHHEEMQSNLLSNIFKWLEFGFVLLFSANVPTLGTKRQTGTLCRSVSGSVYNLSLSLILFLFVCCSHPCIIYIWSQQHLDFWFLYCMSDLRRWKKLKLSFTTPRHLNFFI